MRALRLILVVATAAILAACTTATTINPVGTSGGPQTDARLLGTWLTTGPKQEKFYVFFLERPAEQGYDMQAVAVGPTQGEEHGSWSVLAVTTGKVGDVRFLNGRLLFDSGKPADRTDYFPVVYRLDGKKLTFLLLDPKAAKAAVEAHEIAGTVAESGDVVITAAPAALDAYMASHVDTLFKALDETPVFHRVD